MTQSQQLRKLAARSATAFLLAALCVFPLYIDKFSNLGVVKFTGICTLSWAFALWLGALACVGLVLAIWLYHSVKIRARRLAMES